jgi:hypothetical protein
MKSGRQIDGQMSQSLVVWWYCEVNCKVFGCVDNIEYKESNTECTELVLITNSNHALYLISLS